MADLNITQPRVCVCAAVSSSEGWSRGYDGEEEGEEEEFRLQLLPKETEPFSQRIRHQTQQPW